MPPASQKTFVSLNRVEFMDDLQELESWKQQAEKADMRRKVQEQLMEKRKSKRR